jgi:GDPmannose 4,6-dehydratase
MKAIIFGIHGQDGYYLNDNLVKNSVQVIGVSRSIGNWIQGDISIRVFVEDLIKKHQPDYIFHLAANSTTNHSALFENHETISTGSLNIMESARLHCPTARIFLAGSAMQFKNNGLPISEQTPFEASSPYSVARIQSAFAARYYRNKFGMRVYIGYLFNHDSPMRTERHINQKIVKTVLRIAKGSNELLEIGNLDVQKEFGFAGDTVNALWTLINQDNVFEAVIGTGRAYSLKDWIAGCFEKINKNWLDYVKIKQNYIPEYKILVSDPKLINSLGWEPKVNFMQLVDLMMSNK